MSRRQRKIQEDVPSPNTIIENNKKRDLAIKRIKKRRRRRLILSRLIKLTVVLALITGVYFFDQSKYSRIRKINVSGNQAFSEAELLKDVKINENDRIVSTFFKTFTMKRKAPGIAKRSLKLYYTKGYINLTVEEYPVVGIIEGKKPQYLLADNTRINASQKLEHTVPALKNISSETLDKYPEFADKLSRIDASASNSISEIEKVDEPLEEIYFKFTMNHGYFVYSNLKNILLMDYYPEILSGITSQDNNNKCIYFLDYGHTDDNQSAIARPCTTEE